MKVSHPSPPLPQSWEDAWSAVPELLEMPRQFGRVCHRLLGNSDIRRLPLKCGSKLHHCWHHMGNLRMNLQAIIRSLLGHFRSPLRYLKMKRYALQPWGLLTTCKQCTSSRHMQDCSKCSTCACTCYSQVLWGERRGWQSAETFKSVLGLVFVHVLLGHAHRVLPSFCSKGLDL